MNEGEVRLVQNMIEIMVIIVHLWWGKLTLINDIFGG